MSFVVTIVVWLLEFVLVAAIIAAVALIIYARWNYGTLEKLGFQVVKPHWFMGSNHNGHKIYHHTLDIERSKKYGHFYGIYDGRTPNVCISDPVILRRVLTTDFDHFRNHRQFLDDHPVTKELTDFLDDEKWKVVRATLTPQFTTGKIKQMIETVREVSDEYVAALIKDMNGEKRMKMEFRKYVPPLILEIIGKCFCGIVIENARDPDNKLIETLKTAMGGESFTLDWNYTAATVFPFLQKFAQVFENHALNNFETIMKGIIKGREESKIQKQDMVNTLLEIFKKAKTDPEYKRLGITETTAIAQAFEFFLASYEAVRGTLSILIYYLATHEEVQKKLLQEIDSSLKKTGGKINYDSVSEMPYLAACISETLRIKPSFLRLDRRCTKDWEYEGIKIKKDMIVIFPLYALHHHSEYYENPEEFNPERFMPGQKEKLDPYALGSFGNGPRACIGQRFSYEMLKIITCHYLKEFTIEKRKDTVFDIVKGNPLFLQYEPIYVDFVRRN